MHRHTTLCSGMFCAHYSLQGHVQDSDWRAKCCIKGLAPLATQMLLSTKLVSLLLHLQGYGTVRFETPEVAQAAIQQYHGSDLDGRTLTVRLDKFA